MDAPHHLPVDSWPFLLCTTLFKVPVKCGGMGLRSYVETCAPAFIGAVEMAIPSLYTGYCPQLTEWVGGEDMFGEGVLAAGRWRTLLTDRVVESDRSTKLPVIHCV